MIPVKSSAILQVVVKIKSVQSLEKVGSGVGRKEDIAAKKLEIKPRTSVEYLVLQRRILRGLEGPWKIWGMTEESE